MAIIQHNKGKVRPVMDYIDTLTPDADVCRTKLREWHQQGVNVALLGQWSTYLQIRVHESLWAYQMVLIKREILPHAVGLQVKCGANDHES